MVFEMNIGPYHFRR